MQPRTVAPLPKDDATYLAGLTDGERTIALSGEMHARTGRIINKKPFAPHHAPGLTDVITNRQPLVKHTDDEPIA